MATIQQEIMSIAEANGYDGDAPKTIAEAVNALGTVMGGGGSGGGDPFVVTFTNAGSTYSADKTYTEVIEAMKAGKVVLGKYIKISSNGWLLNCDVLAAQYAAVDSGLGYVGFSRSVLWSVSSSTTPAAALATYVLWENNTVSVLRRSFDAS